MSTVVDQRPRAPDRPPNRAAARITGRPYLSHSQLSLMRACPRKFAFQYLDRAPADFLPASLIFGGSIHSALEFYFRSKLEGLAVTPETLFAAYQNAWRRLKGQPGNDVPVRFGKTDSEDALHQLAVRMIASFLSSPLATPKGAILGIEEELRVELDPDLPDLLAKVDLVTETRTALHVIDFKTSRSRWTDQKAQESGEQLLLYGMTLERMANNLGVPIKLHFAIITKAKTPIVQLLPVSTDKNRVASLTESVRQIWQAIQAGNFYPSPTPQNCTSCQFRSRCPAFAAGK